MWRHRETAQRTGQPAIEPLSHVPPQPAPVRRITSTIGATVRITGSISSDEDLTIAGWVSGPVTVENHRLVVSDGACVTGDVAAEAITIAGTVTGHLTAKELVQIEATGHVKGDVMAPRVAMRDGATIEGRIDTVDPRPAQHHLPIAV
jgi:cytoskeletal protein CcmA (bactofilin family)